MNKEELDRVWLILITVWMIAVTAHDWFTVENAELLHERIVRLERAIGERPEQVNLPALSEPPK